VRTPSCGTPEGILTIILMKYNKVETQCLQSDYDKDCNDHYVACMPHTLYGNVVNWCFRASIDNWDLTAFSMMMFFVGWPTVMCFLMQGTLLGYLWNSLPDFSDRLNSGLCETDATFQLALIMSFLVYMHQPSCDLAFEMYVLIYGTRFHSLTDKTTRTITIRDNVLHLSFAWLCVLMEMAIFVCIVVVGCKYILTSSGASSLIQSALSIVFIAEIDDQIAKAIMPKAAVSDVKFVCELWSGRDNDVKSLAMLQIFFKPAVIVLIVVGIVFGLRDSCC